MKVRELERVELGSWVKVAGFVPGTASVFHFVPEEEVDFRKNKVSVNGVLGRALLGARSGDTVRVDVHDEQLELFVLEVGHESPDH